MILVLKLLLVKPALFGVGAGDVVDVVDGLVVDVVLVAPGVGDVVVFVEPGVGDVVDGLSVVVALELVLLA